MSSALCHRSELGSVALEERHGGMLAPAQQKGIWQGPCSAHKTRHSLNTASSLTTQRSGLVFLPLVESCRRRLSLQRSQSLGAAPAPANVLFFPGDASSLATHGRRVSPNQSNCLWTSYPRGCCILTTESVCPLGTVCHQPDY